MDNLDEIPEEFKDGQDESQQLYEEIEKPKSSYDLITTSAGFMVLKPNSAILVIHFSRRNSDGA